MADGCICLAQLWDSAWKEGGGDTRISDLGEIDQAGLEKLYQNPQLSAVPYPRYDRAAFAERRCRASRRQAGESGKIEGKRAKEKTQDVMQRPWLSGFMI